MDTAQEFDECAFACAVFSHQGVNFSGIEREIHVVQGLDGTKLFRNTAKFSNGFGRFRHILPFFVGLFDGRAYRVISIMWERLPLVVWGRPVRNGGYR